MDEALKGLLVLGGGLAGAFGNKSDSQGSQGYAGGIPEYTAKRTPLLKRFNPAYGGQLDPTTYNPYGSNAPDTPPVYTGLEGARRPGQFGRSYFTNVDYIPKTDAEGIQTVMGGDYLTQLNANALARQQEQQQQGLGLLSLLTGVSVDELPNYFKNRAQGTTDGSTTDGGTTDGGTTDPTEPYFDTATGNKIVPRAEGLPALTLTPYRQGFEPPSTLSGGVIPGSGADMYEPAYTALNQILAGKNTLPEQIEIFDRFGISDETAAKYLGITPSDLVTARENIENKRIADESRAEKAATDAFNAKYPEAGANIKPYISPFTGKPLINKDGAWRGTDGKYYRGTPPGFAGGGLASLGRGYYLGGATDGMADKVPATIDGREPARLSDGEFVIPADVVSHLGNGNSDAGARNLYSMMDRVRKARTGTTRQGRQINPQKYLA